MPDEVFNNWLLPHIQLYGWPFKTPSDNFSDHNWPNCFSIHHTLKQWTECEWELTNIIVDSINLHDRTLKIIGEITINAVEGIQTSATDQIGIGGKERFWACAAFYREHGTLPSPIVFYKFSNYIRILDGFHRLAAIFHIGVPYDFKIPAWFAKI